MGVSTELFRHNGVTAVRGYTKDRLPYTELSRKAAIKNVNDGTRKRGNDCCFFLAPGLQKERMLPKRTVGEQRRTALRKKTVCKRKERSREESRDLRDIQSLNNQTQAALGPAAGPATS